MIGYASFLKFIGYALNLATKKTQNFCFILELISPFYFKRNLFIFSLWTKCTLHNQWFYYEAHIVFLYLFTYILVIVYWIENRTKNRVLHNSNSRFFYWLNEESAHKWYKLHHNFFLSFLFLVLIWFWRYVQFDSFVIL